MTRNRRRRLLAATTALLLLTGLFTAIGAASRLTSRVAFAAYASDGVSSAAGSDQVEAVVELRTSAAARGLTALARSRARTSPSSRRQALARLTPSVASRADVVRFARRHGLTVEASSSWTVLLRGRAAAMASAFGTPLHKVSSPLDARAGRAFLAPTAAPAVPTSLRSVATAVVGLDNRPVWHAQAVPTGYTGADLGAAYGITRGGSGITIATEQFAPMDVSTLTTYAGAAGLTLAPGQFTLESVDGAAASASSGSGEDEDSLDAEALLAVAPSATQRMYVAPNSSAAGVEMDSEIADAAAAGQVQVVSTSWGSCEGQTGQLAAQDTQLERILAAGATIFASSGDTGSADCQGPPPTASVDYPASSPYVVGVGGTSLTRSGSTWSDSGWSDTEGESGGGMSTVEARPSWQSSVGIAGTHRLVPDIASDGDPETGFGAYADDKGRGGWADFGGTSLAAPTQAAALADSLSAAGRTTGVGDIHAALYSAPASDFRDVTTGASNGQFSPGVGYDEVTGLGAPLWSGLATALGLTASSSPNPTPSTTVDPAPSASASPTATATASASPPTASPTATATATSSPRARERVTVQLSSPARGRLRIRVATRPVRRRTPVLLYAVGPHGRLHRIGKARTTSIGRALWDHHEHPGARLRIRVKVAGSDSVSTGISPVHRIRIRR